MKIFIGADHRGYELKEQLKSWLEAMGHAIVDCGNSDLDPGDDYPDFAIAVGEKVAASMASNNRVTKGDDSQHQNQSASADQGLGIVICGSGVGASIAANKVVGVRAGQALSSKEVEHARSRDQINVLSLSADYLGLDQAKKLVQTFLTTKIAGNEKDERRIEKISRYESLS